MCELSLLGFCWEERQPVSSGGTVASYLQSRFNTVPSAGVLGIGVNQKLSLHLRSMGKHVWFIKV